MQGKYDEISNNTLFSELTSGEEESQDVDKTLQKQKSVVEVCLYLL